MNKKGVKRRQKADPDKYRKEKEKRIKRGVTEESSESVEAEAPAKNKSKRI